MTNTITNQWMNAKANAVRIVSAPGKKFLTETAYLADGSRVIRIVCHGDGYTTVTKYPRSVP